MECEVCKSGITIFDWLMSPFGKKICINCRGIYTDEEKKSKDEMFKKIADIRKKKVRM